MTSENKTSMLPSFVLGRLTWAKTVMICAILLCAGIAAYFGANVTVNVNLTDRVTAIERTLQVPIGSSFYPFQNPATYTVGYVDGKATLQNGTTGYLDWYVTNHTAIIQAGLDNASEAGGGSVYVKTGAYNASVIARNNTLLIIDKGATGITYSIDTEATCVIEDYQNGLAYYYVQGTLQSYFDMTSGSLFHLGTAFPDNPHVGEEYYRTDLSTQCVFNGTEWIYLEQIPSDCYASIFLKYFPSYRQIVWNQYNVTEGAVDSLPYYDTQDITYYNERFSLSYYPLEAILAYELTGNKQYLMEAKYFLDCLDNYVNVNGSLISYYQAAATDNRAGFQDTALTLAKQKLNEHGVGNYNITDEVNKIIAAAKVNNDTDMGWSYLWDTPNLAYGGLNRFSPFALLFAYLTSKGVGDYSAYIPKIVHFIQRTVYSGSPGTNLLTYGFPSEGYTTPDFHYTGVTFTYLALASAFEPALVDNSFLQNTMNALNNSVGIYCSTTEITQFATECFIANKAGLTLTEYEKTAMYEFANDYAIQSLADFPGGSVSYMRVHMLQVIHTMLVLGLFPSTIIPVTTPQAFTTGTNGVEVRVTTAPNKQFIRQNYGIRLPAPDVGLQTDIFYPNSVWLSTPAWNSTTERWMATSSYGGTNLTLTFDRTMTTFWLNFTSPTQLIMNLGGSYCTEVMVENGTVFTLWNYTDSTGLGNGTHIFSSHMLQMYEKTNAAPQLRCAFDSDAQNCTLDIRSTYGHLNFYCTYAELHTTPFDQSDVNANFRTALLNVYSTMLTMLMNGSSDIRVLMDFSNVGNIQNEFRYVRTYPVFFAPTTNTSVFIVSAVLVQYNLTVTLTSATSQNATLEIYCGVSGQPTNVVGADSSSYDSTSTILTVSKQFSGTTSVTICFPIG